MDSFKTIGNGLDHLDLAIEGYSEGQLQRHVFKLEKIYDAVGERLRAAEAKLEKLRLERLEEECRERKLLQVKEMGLLVNKLFEKDAELQEVQVTRSYFDGAYRTEPLTLLLNPNAPLVQQVEVEMVKDMDTEEVVWVGRGIEERDIVSPASGRVLHGVLHQVGCIVTDEQKEVGLMAEKLFENDTEIHEILVKRNGEIATRAREKDTESDDDEEEKDEEPSWKRWEV